MMRSRKPTAALLVGLLALPALSKPKSGTDAAYRQKLSKHEQIVHALNRLTFGPRPGDIEAVRRAGLKKWIDQQLHPERIRESAELEDRLRPLTSLSLDSAQLVQEYPPPQMIVAYATGRKPMPQDSGQLELVQRLAARYKARLAKQGVDEKALGVPETPALDELLSTEQIRTLRKGAPEERDALLQSLPPDKLRKVALAVPRSFFPNLPPGMRREALRNVAPQQVVAQDLQEAKLYRAVYGRRQLAEVLTDFWFNHFNVYLDKGADQYLLTSYERDAIRPNILGRFRDLLQATAESPAMLFYLDNWQSSTPDTPARRAKAPKARPRGLNENYARELLELHTLGVDGGYTQKDIVEVARCFTGWTIREPYAGAQFQFNERMHDTGEKIVLGVTIPAGGGKEDGLKVLDILARHPSTARFLSRKLAQRFVSDNPPAPLVAAMAETFQRTDGDLREVLRTMLGSREFFSKGAYRSKIKSPFEMVASALRATGADVTFAFGLAGKVAELGQPLYRKQEPTGYSNNSEEWVNSAALLGRMNFALALAKNQLPGTKIVAARYSGDPLETARQLLVADLSRQTREAIERGTAQKREPATVTGLVLGSPEFQRR